MARMAEIYKSEAEFARTSTIKNAELIFALQDKFRMERDVLYSIVEKQFDVISEWSPTNLRKRLGDFW